METGIPSLQRCAPAIRRPSAMSINTACGGGAVLIALRKKIDLCGDSVFNFCIDLSCSTGWSPRWDLPLPWVTNEKPGTSFH